MERVKERKKDGEKERNKERKKEGKTLNKYEKCRVLGAGDVRVSQENKLL